MVTSTDQIQRAGLGQWLNLSLTPTENDSTKTNKIEMTH